MTEKIVKIKVDRFPLHITLIVFFVLHVFQMSNGNGAEIVDRIVAVVNEDIISFVELNEAVKPYVDRIRKMGSTAGNKEKQLLSKVRDDVLKQLIERKLADQEIKRANITVSEKEIDSAIENVKQAGAYSDEDFEKLLSREGLTLEAYRNIMKEQTLRTKLVNIEVRSKIVITREDVKSYYEMHRDIYGEKKKYHLRNILMKVSRFADSEQKLSVQKKMEAILKKLADGHAFEELARKYSESPLSANGGDLGLFQIQDLSPQLQDALKGKEEGQYTQVLDTEQGYQIFFIQEILTIPGKTLEEVTPEIEEKLYREIVDTKYQEWLEDLKKQAHIRIID